MNDEILGRIPPHDNDAEEAVLGSMLVDKDAVLTVLEILKPEDFYKPENEEIYAAILDLYEATKPIDLLTLKEQLRIRGKYDVVNGFEYLASLTNPMYSISNVGDYANIVWEKSILRKLIAATNKISKESYEAATDATSIAENAEKQIFNIIQRKSSSYALIKDVLVDTINNLEELASRTEPVVGIPSGFTDLDNRTLGFMPGQLIIIAARPAMGKSAFALNVLTNAAMRAGKSVVYFSLEMAKEELVNRILAAEAMVDSQKIRSGKLEDEDWISLTNASGSLSEAKIILDDSSGFSPIELRAKCRKLKMEYDIELVINNE